MNEKQYLTISAFARLSNIGRRTLIYYDEIGLFSPEMTAANGYRYYTPGQLDTAWLIGTLKALGVPLKEIKAYMDRRTPDEFVSLLQKEKEKMAQKILQMERMQEEICCHIGVTEESFGVDAATVRIQHFEEERIFLGPPVDRFYQEDVLAAIQEFYNDCEKKGQSLNYPMGLKIRQNNIQNCQTGMGDRYYFKVPVGEGKKPAGNYLVGYYYGFGKGAGLYKQLAAYVQGHLLQMTGDAYEDYLLNEASVKNPEEYLVRVQLPVAQKK